MDYSSSPHSDSHEGGSHSAQKVAPVENKVASNMSGKSIDAEESGPVAMIIKQKIYQAFSPVNHFSLIDESHKHAGHAGMEGAARRTETHFKLTIVSEVFEGKLLIDRHRAVNECLS